ncbi:BadF/BadG/BcrA/BcrD ATPase family protein [Aurantimicrobium minutum]|uniref:BadF/BadG/BcrA/BcrD ATPase family protein n=1 Tax=Aurantimicrobium minutum TaxID=708131 RepID=UPI002475CBC9|nr:BadF/BadG/BcrA/BcrD ATPase family protein [Aurantimicrobium minutum]MDH6238785.1 glucosamine kinase [Aurantimicrobium minutum]
MNFVKPDLLTLALDAGQTGVRTLLIDGDSRSLQQFPGVKTDRELFPQLAEFITTSLEGLNAPVSLSIGMTGLTAAQSKPAELLELLPANVLDVSLAHDSITGFLGALGTQLGVVTAVGTGVVTLGVGETDMVRIDGWGNLIGDAGSAYWIGRAGLEAGMRVYDGRILSSSLLTLLTENFSHPEEAYIELQTDPNRVARIASYAKRVIELAEKDEEARRIVNAAGHELALSAVTAAERVGLRDSDTPLFSWVGNVMKAEMLKDAFVSAVVKAVPQAQFVSPLAEPIEGVALMSSLPEASPLRASIHTASRE